MKKKIRITESELTAIIKKVVSENNKKEGLNRHADLADIVSKFESKMGINLGDVDGDITVKAKKLDSFLEKKLLELNSLHNELKSALLGLSVTTSERIPKKKG